ncbi:MAG: DNA-directed RNA polymerase subunit alpha, partial [Thermogemmatispora sp.]
DLSVRAYNCLKRSNITKVGQILSMNEEDLLGVRNFGEKSLQELRDRLIARNFLPTNLRASTVGAEMNGDHEREG